MGKEKPGSRISCEANSHSPSDVIAAMLEGKNNTFSLLWEIRSIFMQNCFIVSAFNMAAVKTLYTEYSLVFVSYII